jgi:hypothetical protein
MERWTFESQQTDIPANSRPDNLYQPVTHDGGERGHNWSGHTRQTSLYSRAFLHPTASLVAMLAVAMAVAMTAKQRKKVGGGPVQQAGLDF